MEDMNNMPIRSLKLANELGNGALKWVSPKELIELAINQKVPHYVVKNPLTGQEQLYFITKEIEDWFRNGYVKRFEPNVNQEIFNIWIFNDCDKVDSFKIPKSLWGIKDVYEIPVRNIRTPPGIYFLCHQSQVVYVGQSENIGARIIEHEKNPEKVFDSIYWIMCPINRLNSLESAFIRHLQPKYNKTRHKKDLYNRDKLILRGMGLDVD